MKQAVIKLPAIVLAGVLAAATFSLYTFEAAAYDRDYRGGDGNSTDIEVENEATVSNNISVTANTGGNDVEGGDGDDGGNGGDTNNGTGGSGGNGGDGGEGGAITTGMATAIGTVYNEVNSNDVEVETCGCDEDLRVDFISRFFRDNNDGNSLDLEAENEATVDNNLDVMANTGRNYVSGGDGDDGGDGGDAGDRHSRLSWFSWFLNQDNVGGNGGDGGTGGSGGTIETGEAYSDGLVTNVINRNVVRTLNGADDTTDD